MLLCAQPVCAEESFRLRKVFLFASVSACRLPGAQRLSLQVDRPEPCVLTPTLNPKLTLSIRVIGSTWSHVIANFDFSLDVQIRIRNVSSVPLTVLDSRFGSGSWAPVRPSIVYPGTVLSMLFTTTYTAGMEASVLAVRYSAPNQIGHLEWYVTLCLTSR